MRVSVSLAYLACTLIFAADARGQQLVILGTVRSERGEPLANAAVMVDGMGVAGLTRENGSFSIVVPEQRVHGQSVRISARLIGYYTDSLFALLRGDSIVHDFVLRSRPLVLGPVITMQPDSSNSEAKELAAEFGAVDTPVLRSARLTALDKTVQPNGRREIRVWTGISIGIPKMLYRFVQDDSVASGELIYYWNWPNSSGSSIWSELQGKLRSTAASWCARANFTGTIWTCSARFTDSPDWNALWKSVEDAGVFEPHDYSLLKSPYGVQMDGWEFTVETWDGKVYHRWTPRLGNSSEEFARRDALARLVSQLDGHVVSVP
jgi:hypothetical protein